MDPRSGEGKLTLMDRKPDLQTTERFISALESIKGNLERVYNRSFTGVGAAINHARQNGHKVAQQNEPALTALINLRNAIQHNAYKRGAPIATPRGDAVEQAEVLAEHIANHPPVRDFMVKNPAVLQPSTPLELVATQIVDNELSQLPVYDGGSYLGLFTTNALARWFSKSVRTDGGVVFQGESTVTDILPHAEAHEKAMFFKPSASAYKVCDKLSGGQPDTPIAALVTTDGTAAGQLQGLVTRFDVPRILRELTIKFP